MTSFGCSAAKGRRTWRGRCWQHWRWAPLSWKKTHLTRGHRNLPQVLTAASKHSFGPHPNVRCFSHCGPGRWPPRWGNRPRYGCWPSCCVSSSTRHSSPYLPKSSWWWGCSDASASDQGVAFVRGWCSNRVEPEKTEVYWGIPDGESRPWRCDYSPPLQHDPHSPRPFGRGSRWAVTTRATSWQCSTLGPGTLHRGHQLVFLLHTHCCSLSRAARVQPLG